MRLKLVDCFVDQILKEHAASFLQFVFYFCIDFDGCSYIKVLRSQVGNFNACNYFSLYLVVRSLFYFVRLRLMSFVVQILKLPAAIFIQLFFRLR